MFKTSLNLWAQYFWYLTKKAEIPSNLELQEYEFHSPQIMNKVFTALPTDLEDFLWNMKDYIEWEFLLSKKQLSREFLQKLWPTLSKSEQQVLLDTQQSFTSLGE